MSPGSTPNISEAWWLTLTRDGDVVVDDHRVRVGPESEHGAALAAVLAVIA